MAWANERNNVLLLPFSSRTHMCVDQPIASQPGKSTGRGKRASGYFSNPLEQVTVMPLQLRVRMGNVSSMLVGSPYLYDHCNFWDMCDGCRGIVRVRTTQHGEVIPQETSCQ